MYENTFIDMFDPSIIQDFSQSVAPLPYQNINFFPPTPPQQMHLYPEDNMSHINNTCLVDDADSPSYEVESTDYNMDSTQSLEPFSLQIENKNTILTPSPSTETCSSSVMNSTRELFQDFSLYPSNYTQHNNNPVDQGSALTPNHTDYACNDVFLQLSPRSSCSPQTHHAHPFYPNTTSNKKKATGSNKKKNQCTLCPKRFGRPQELQRHQVCHTGERKFPCTRCKKTFARRDAMLRHCKSHFKDKAKNMARI